MEAIRSSIRSFASDPEVVHSILEDTPETVNYELSQYFHTQIALEEIRQHRDILYDATVVDTCIRLFKEKGYKLK
jgi:N-dimethylarginine dimethylaminohydrolase